jgi:hypothetical protein
MPAGNGPLAGDEIVDVLTRDAQKRVSGQLVPLFKPVHWRDLSAKTLNRIALTRLFGEGEGRIRSKIFSKGLGTGYVAENEEVGILVEGAGEGENGLVFGNFGDDLAQGGFLALAGSEDDELAGRPQGSVAEGDASWRRFGGGNGAVNGGVIDERFGFAGEQRAGMAVFAHAEDDEIENGLAGIVEGSDAAKFRLGFLGGVGVFGFAVDTMDLFGADVERIIQELASGQEIGLWIGGRNAAFVREEEVDVIDVAAFGTDLGHDGLVKRLSNPTAGERNVKGDAIGNGLNEVAGGGFGKRLRRDKLL